MTPTTLYRFYDASDRLLYVGISKTLTNRFEQHAKTKGWWTEVARTTLEHFATRAAAENAERMAIVDEQPAHNVVHNRGKASRATRTELTWYCDVCRDPVANGDGYLQAVKAAGRKWMVMHRGCDPFAGDTGYWIAVERYRTPDDDTAWYRHLYSKAWFDYEDWDDMTERSMRYPNEPPPSASYDAEFVSALQALCQPKGKP